MGAKLLWKENADPAESILPYTNKRPLRVLPDFVCSV